MTELETLTVFFLHAPVAALMHNAHTTASSCHGHGLDMEAI